MAKSQNLMERSDLSPLTGGGFRGVGNTTIGSADSLSHKIKVQNGRQSTVDNQNKKANP